MRRRPALTSWVLAFVSGCGSPTQPSAPAPTVVPVLPATVYSASDGHSAWHLQGNRFWSGSPAELRAVPLREAPATVRYSRTAGVACIDLGGMAFGAPDLLRKGAQFQCGVARFEVVDCDFPDDCRNALIEAIWRGEVPVNYYYNRCRGVQSITFSLDRPLRVGFGTTLELRQGTGLLAQPDTPACRRDPSAGLMD